MAKVNRAAIESPLVQGQDEAVPYRLDTTPWGGTPTDPTVVVKNGNGSEVTVDVMPTNSPTVSGNFITLSKLQSLKVGRPYRLEIKWTGANGEDWEAFAEFEGEV